MLDLRRLERAEPKELAQSIAPSTAASMYSPPNRVLTIIEKITVCNTSNASRWFSLWVDQDGTTYDNTTKRFHQVDIPGKSTMVIDGPIYMRNPSGNLATRAQNATDITITLDGIEIKLN